MFEGVLIAESLRAGASLATPLTVSCVERIAPRDVTGAQPDRWTLVHFRVPPDVTDRLAGELADALDAPGWYADFRSASTTYVVFPGTVFRYSRGDTDGRAAAVAYGRAVGVPDGQLDWPV